MNTNIFLQHSNFFATEALCLTLSSLALCGTQIVIFKEAKYREIDTELFSTITKVILQEVLLRGIVQPTIKHGQKRFYTWYRKREATEVELTCQKRFRIVTTAFIGTILDRPSTNLPLLEKIYEMFYTFLRELSYSEIRESTSSVAPTVLVRGLRSLSDIAYGLEEISALSRVLLGEAFHYIVDSISTQKLEKSAKNILLNSVNTLFLDIVTRGVFKNLSNFTSIHDCVIVAPLREEIVDRYFFHTQMKKIQKAFFFTFRNEEKISTEEEEILKENRIFSGAIFFGGAHALNVHGTFVDKAQHVFSCALNGVSLGRLFETHKSLLPSISAHFLHNFIVLCSFNNIISNIFATTAISFSELFLYNYSSSKNLGEIKEDIKGKIDYSAKKLKECSQYLVKKGSQVALFSLPLLLIIALANKQEHYKVPV